MPRSDPAPSRSGSKTGSWARKVGAAVVFLVALVAIRAIVRGVRSASSVDPLLSAKQSSRAVGFLPKGCDVAARIDLDRVLSLEPVRRRLVGAFGDLAAALAADPKGRGAEELLRKTGIDPAVDLKQLALCAMHVDAARPDVALVLAGDLHPEAVVTALEAVGEGVHGGSIEFGTFEGRKTAKRRPGADGKGWILGQAADAAIVLATSESLFAAVVAAGGSDAGATAYALPADQEVAFVFGPAVLRRTALARSEPLGDALSGVDHATGVIGLASPSAELRIALADAGHAAELEVVLRKRILPALRQRFAGRPGQFGEMEALEGATTQVDGSEVVLHAPWSAEGVEQLAERIADAMRRQRSGALDPPPP